MCNSILVASYPERAFRMFRETDSEGSICDIHSQSSWNTKNLLCFGKYMIVDGVIPMLVHFRPFCWTEMRVLLEPVPGTISVQTPPCDTSNFVVLKVMSFGHGFWSFRTQLDGRRMWPIRHRFPWGSFKDFSVFLLKYAVWHINLYKSGRPNRWTQSEICISQYDHSGTSGTGSARAFFVHFHIASKICRMTHYSF